MLSDGRLVWARRDVEVWLCPFCGSAERYDPPQRGDSPAYVPNCEWCADDPEGGGEVAMVRHIAAPVAAYEAAPSDPAEAIAKAICESSRETNNEPDWEHEDEWIKDGFREGEAAAVLRALGVSSPHAANTDTT